MQIAKKVQAGFTLIELMIVVAIIGILASIAIPQYEAFIQRSEFKAMETAGSTYKVGVELCIQEHSSAGAATSTDTLVLANCDADFKGRLGDIQQATITGDRNDDVDTVGVTNGVITVTSLAGAFGIPTATTYIMTPHLTFDSRGQVKGSTVWNYQSTDAGEPGYKVGIAEGTCYASRLCR